MRNIDNNTHDKIEQSIADVDWASYQAWRFTPLPAVWEDIVFYFLMPNCFSDGKEKGYIDNNGNPVTTGPHTFFNLSAKFLKYTYSAEPAQIGSSIKIESKNSKAVHLTASPDNFVIYE
ncbi:hypothetical protein [Nitrosomonas sp. Is37]|uniref:hypothetical protein n=1 Tax=Nitrosomonas sp. Is37 TaxID=3080535 RepID=UPI00294AB0BA|nr:hypothetical protein [Nitrosomonas sp. Is37]MDV6344943.1 hypothetical protein [Nitrosomonas sp. Is37]